MVSRQSVTAYVLQSFLVHRMNEVDMSHNYKLGYDPDNTVYSSTSTASEVIVMHCKELQFMSLLV